MKCCECPCLKYDGMTYICPQNPYVHNIDMYTENAECHGVYNYLRSIKDELKYLYGKVREQNLIIFNLQAMTIVDDEIKESIRKRTMERDKNYERISYLTNELNRVRKNMKEKC